MDALSDIVKGSVSAFVASWTRIKKASDTARASNSTVSDDPDLQFSMAASKKYAIRLRVWFDTAATPDFKFRHAGPASPTLLRIRRAHIVGGGTAFAGIATDTAFSAADVAVAGSGVSGYVEFDGIVHNGSNAGTFSFQWAQNTSNASATTVRAGSYIEYIEI